MQLTYMHLCIWRESCLTLSKRMCLLSLNHAFRLIMIVLEYAHNSSFHASWVFLHVSRTRCHEHNNKHYWEQSNGLFCNSPICEDESHGSNLFKKRQTRICCRTFRRHAINFHPSYSSDNMPHKNSIWIEWIHWVLSQEWTLIHPICATICIWFW